MSVKYLRSICTKIHGLSLLKSIKNKIDSYFTLKINH